MSELASQGALRRVLIGVGAFAIGPAVAGELVYQAELVHGAAAAPNQGSAIVADGTRVIVGARGAAVHWIASGRSWRFVEMISHPTGPTYFGAALALVDDKLVVGDPQASGAVTASGAAFVYRLNLHGAFEFEQRLESPTPLNQGLFGESVAIWQDRILVGAPSESSLGPGIDNPRDGGVHVFERDFDGQFVATATGRAPNQRGAGGYGSTVVAGSAGFLVSEPDAVVPAGTQSRGAVHSCAYPVPGTLVCTQYLRPGGVAFDHFGTAIASTDASTAVSSPRGTGAIGDVVVYGHEPMPWQIEATIEGPEHARGWSFGSAVARVAGNLFASAPQRNDSTLGLTGTVYQFESTPAGWLESHRFSVPNGRGHSFCLFGDALATAGDHLFVGAPNLASETRAGQGAVFAFVLPVLRDGFE